MLASPAAAVLPHAVQLEVLFPVPFFFFSSKSCSYSWRAILTHYRENWICGFGRPVVMMACEHQNLGNPHAVVEGHKASALLLLDSLRRWAALKQQLVAVLRKILLSANFQSCCFGYSLGLLFPLKIVVFWLEVSFHFFWSMSIGWVLSKLCFGQFCSPNIKFLLLISPALQLGLKLRGRFFLVSWWVLGFVLFFCRVKRHHLLNSGSCRWDFLAIIAHQVVEQMGISSVDLGTGLACLWRVVLSYQNQGRTSKLQALV